MPFITGARLKAERAGVHLKEFEAMADNFINEHSHIYSRKLNPQNLDNYIYEFPPYPPPPMDLAVVLGDVTHNLRSALDHIAWQLALLHTAEPIPATAFPILLDTSSKNVDRWKTLTKDILPDAKRVIEAVQPYHRGDAAKYDGLWIPHLLWNEDKHRFVATTPSRLTVPVFIGPGGRWTDLKDGSRRIEIPRSAEPEKYFEPSITRQILFQIPRSNDRVPLSILRSIYHLVADEIIPLFARFLPESGGLVERVQGFVERTHQRTASFEALE
jgi:hypothetical protein